MITIFASILFSLLSAQLPQYVGSVGSGSPRGTVGIGSGDSRQGSGGFSAGSGSSSTGFTGNNGFNGGGIGGGGGNGGGGDHQGLDWLRDALPGEPDVDYPVYSLPPPESSFSSDGRVKLLLMGQLSTFFLFSG